MAQHARPVGPTGAFDAAGFSPEMTQGTGQPQRNRERLPLRLGLQATPPDVAPFSPDMVQGARPDRSRAWLPLRTGWYADQAPHEPAAFSMEMSQGTRPIEAPWTRAVHFRGWSVSQLTHVDAPFTVSMSAGAAPARNRAWLPLRTGWYSPPVEGAPFTIDMIQGAQPARGRAWLPVRLGWRITPPDVAPFSIDMVIGVTVPRPRLHIPAPRRQGWQQDPGAHIPAPITLDMLAGWRPDRPIRLRPLRTGLQVLVSDLADGPVTVRELLHPVLGAYDSPVLPSLGQVWG